MGYDSCFLQELKAFIEKNKANKDVFFNACGWDFFKKDRLNLAIEISTEQRQESDHEIKILNNVF